MDFSGQPSAQFTEESELCAGIPIRNGRGYSSETNLGVARGLFVPAKRYTLKLTGQRLFFGLLFFLAQP